MKANTVKANKANKVNRVGKVKANKANKVKAHKVKNKESHLQKKIEPPFNLVHRQKVDGKRPREAYILSQGKYVAGMTVAQGQNYYEVISALLLLIQKGTIVDRLHARMWIKKKLGDSE